MFIYFITAQCLQPIGGAWDISETSGLYYKAVRAGTLAEAIAKVIRELAERYEAEGYLTVMNYGARTVKVMDAAAHIVNCYWGFRGHRV